MAVPMTQDTIKFSNIFNVRLLFKVPYELWYKKFVKQDPIYRILTEKSNLKKVHITNNDCPSLCLRVLLDLSN